MARAEWLMDSVVQGHVTPQMGDSGAQANAGTASGVGGFETWGCE